MPPDNHFLILTAQSSDFVNILGLVADLCSKNQCHILETKLQSYGGDSAIIMLIGGKWHAGAKLEASLPVLEKTYKLSFQCKRSLNCSRSATGLPYQAQLIASDRPGILAELCNFFTKNSIQIDDCQAETYLPPKSETKMCQLQINIRIPTKSHIASLRESFMAYCDELNLDALLEPLK